MRTAGQQAARRRASQRGLREVAVIAQALRSRRGGPGVIRCPQAAPLPAAALCPGRTANLQTRHGALGGCKFFKGHLPAGAAWRAGVAKRKPVMKFPV